MANAALSLNVNIDSCHTADDANSPSLLTPLPQARKITVITAAKNGMNIRMIAHLSYGPVFSSVINDAARV